MPDPITSTEIQVGKPNKKDLWERIKAWIEDLNSRLSAAEIGATSRPDIGWAFIGSFDPGDVEDGFAYLPPLSIATKLIGFKLFVVAAGTSGTLTVDVEYKRGAGAWTSILQSPVSADYTDGDLFEISGDLDVTDFLPGDIFRVNLDSVQGDQGDFNVTMQNEVAA